MTVAGVIAIALMILVVTLVAKMPIAICLTASGAIGLVLLKGFGYSVSVLGSNPFSHVATFSLTILPMFILMGMLAVNANLAEQVFQIASHAVRKLPGGLGIATVMACAGFSAVSGTSMGTAATMAKFAVSEMRKHGYPAPMAAALVAVAGTLGVMIPPSTFLVLYAIMADQSVAQMLAAGILPGIISALAYSIYIVFASAKVQRKNLRDADSLEGAIEVARMNAAANAAGGARAVLATAAPSAPAQTLRSLPWRGGVRIVILFLIVLGGMYSGVFTATEAAAIGAFVALLFLILENRRGGRRKVFDAFKSALLETGSTTSMVFLIVVGASVFSTFIIAAGVPVTITSWVESLPVPPLVVVALLLLTLIPLGMFLDSLSILVISIPILLPVVSGFGLNEVWLGVLIVMLIEIGMVTPPVGINVFVVSAVSKVPSAQIFRAVAPLFCVQLGVATLLFLYPDISTLLPSLVRPGS